ncbi:type II/IV secretion system protein [Ruminiclostridium cellobioparum]|uniref:type II/IV secretion system protein n=1 Tax=Ruminiclostridium cellobioparum TaxID=29355 RepID=UPI0028AA5A37|nr:ATPase, T2SS/T4P/T4SS family [Ruminiclostridium cellobioparum]
MLGIAQKEIEDILLEEGLINMAQLKEAWSLNISLNKPILDILLEHGSITEKQALMVKAKKMNIEYVDLENFEFEDITIPKTIPEAIARRYCAIPYKLEGNNVFIAMKDPADLFALDDLTLSTKYQINPVFGSEIEIEKHIEKVFKKESAKAKADHLKEIRLSEEDIANLDKEKIQKILEAHNKGNSPIFKSQLGDLLVNSGVLDEEKLKEALKIQAEKGGKIGEVLVRENFIQEDVLYKFLEVQMNTSYIDLKEVEIPADTIKLVKDNLARRYGLIPVEQEGDILKVAMADPLDVFALDDLRLSTGMEIIPMLAKEQYIIEKIDLYYEKQAEPELVPAAAEAALNAAPAYSGFISNNDLDEEMKKVNEEIAVEIQMVQQEEDLNDLSDVANAPIVKMVNIIFQKAIAQRASDIHIEPYEDCIVIRYRVDGQLMEIMRHDKKILSSMVARIKIISSLNIAEKRIPQDGRITIMVNKKNYDMRVSILPTVHGEKVVIRIADKEAFNVSKKDLGLFEDDMEKFNDIMDNPHGIVLVTGPTGSGKSTTLYTALRELSKPNVNILTVEDPVECAIKGINQVQVNSKAGLSFSSALRAFLRQDPDIIMVGEIRDGETAEIATRAAITGHLVLSTLHTNDAASSITRIIDMGIEPFIISSSIVGVIAQRLVRRLCPKCKSEHILDENEKLLLKLDTDEEVKIYQPKGCSACNNSGYKGRIAIYEIMNITRKHREMIAKNVTSDELKELSVSLGMHTLRDSCVRLVKEGTTSMDEMLRVTYSKD